MKKEILKEKLESLFKEMENAKRIEETMDEHTKEYLYRLEKLVNDYIKKVETDELAVSNGGNLGFRRAILEYDNLANVDSLYDAACEVDFFYSNECKSWN